MQDLQAQLIHDMQNTAMVLREAAGRLHAGRESLTPQAAAHLTEMMTRRSDLLIRLLRDLSISHLAECDGPDLGLQRVSLADICDEMLAVRQPDIGARIAVDVADDALVVGDPLRITQVLDNLVTNAHRYGGPQVSVTAERSGSVVRLTVSDDGAGVPEELLPTLFEGYTPGATSVRSGGGGLGLLIARQLCDAMGGTIEHDGTGGTRFTVTLPALPTCSRQLGVDAAGSGHCVFFWSQPQELEENLLRYVAHGLAAGEAVVVAATNAHHELLEHGLASIGIDPAAVVRSGQYLRLDAEELHDGLAVSDHIDRARFDSLIGDAVRRVADRWGAFRVFGEIVDLYWRRSDEHLALELEACWNDLRGQVAFPLLCGYELAPDHGSGAILACHDALVPA